MPTKPSLFRVYPPINRWIALNPYVLRQKEDSRFSHYSGHLDDVVRLANECFESAEPGYRDGVLLVRVPPEGFFSGVVQLKDGQGLSGSFSPRRKGESPRKSVVANGAAKMPAVRASLVLYRSDVLAEDGDNCLEPTETNWEVVSINASPVDGDTPISPTTLMHNHFGSDGGTDTNMSDSEFVAALRVSFEFWADKAMCG